jgi:hypothetical protein
MERWFGVTTAATSAVKFIVGFLRSCSVSFMIRMFCGMSCASNQEFGDTIILPTTFLQTTIIALSKHCASMNKVPSIVCMLAVCLSFPRTTHSWGFETLRRSPKCSTLLRLRGREPGVDTDTPIESYRFKLENIFNPSYDLDEFAFVRERAEELASGTFAEDLNIGGLFDTCSGQDCEECEIPKEWKTIGSAGQLDVLEFLGIQRAKPLIARAADTN